MEKTFLKSAAVILICCFFSTSLHAQKKIVGYLPLYSLRQPDIGKIPYQKITHLNLAFVRPDSLGNISIPAWVDSVIALAHEANVKVLASIGGGSPPAYYQRLLSERKNVFIRLLLQMVKDHSLDGIDVDIEGKLIDSNYESFVTDLSYSMKKEHKLLTAAVATWVSFRITDKALRVFDFVNIMSYDKTGPWTPATPGAHAPYAMAVTDLEHWRKERRLRRKKLVLGVPFYGYRFGKNGINSMSYAEILLQDSNAINRDSLILKDGSTVYYNGPDTIQRKTRLAKKYAGGVMIWQLLQDAADDKSLLGAINTIIRSNHDRIRE